MKWRYTVLQNHVTGGLDLVWGLRQASLGKLGIGGIEGVINNLANANTFSYLFLDCKLFKVRNYMQIIIYSFIFFAPSRVTRFITITDICGLSEWNSLTLLVKKKKDYKMSISRRWGIESIWTYSKGSIIGSSLVLLSLLLYASHMLSLPLYCKHRGGRKCVLFVFG